MKLRKRIENHIIDLENELENLRKKFEDEDKKSKTGIFPAYYQGQILQLEFEIRKLKLFLEWYED